MAEAILAGKKVLWCGNGGSASDAQHLAAELVGHFQRERRGLPSNRIDNGLIGSDGHRKRLWLRECIRTLGGSALR